MRHEGDIGARAANESATSAGADVQAEVDAIRSDVQALTATLARLADKQFAYAQDRAIEAAREAEAAIRRNPLPAMAIAAGLGFVFGLFTRR